MLCSSENHVLAAHGLEPEKSFVNQLCTGVKKTVHTKAPCTKAEKCRFQSKHCSVITPLPQPMEGELCCRAKPRSSSITPSLLESTSNQYQAPLPRAIASFSRVNNALNAPAANIHICLCYSTCGLMTPVFHTESHTVLPRIPPQEHSPPPVPAGHMCHINQAPILTKVQ